MQVDFDYGVDSIEMVIINSMAPMESFTAELGRGQSEFPIKNYIGQQARQAPAGKRPWQDGSSQEEEHSLNPETRCQGEKVCCFNWVLPSLCLHVSGKVPRKRSNNFAGDEMIVVVKEAEKEEWDSLGQFFKLKRLIVEPTNLFMNLIIFEVWLSFFYTFVNCIWHQPCHLLYALWVNKYVGYILMLTLVTHE